MRLLVDELPKAKEECPFYRKTKWLNDCVRTENYCTLKNEHCDLNTRTGCRTTCSGLLEGAEREVYYT